MSRVGLIVVGAWLALLAGCAWIAWHASYTTDLSAFLPRTPTASKCSSQSGCRHCPRSMQSTTPSDWQKNYAIR